MGNRFSKAVSRLLFQAPEPSYEQNRAILTIQTKNYDLIPAFYFNIDAENTILFSHANAEDLGLVVRHIKQLARELNCNIFCYDYAGYGLSTWREKRRDLKVDDVEGMEFIEDVSGGGGRMGGGSGRVSSVSGVGNGGSGRVSEVSAVSQAGINDSRRTSARTNPDGRSARSNSGPRWSRASERSEASSRSSTSSSGGSTPASSGTADRSRTEPFLPPGTSGTGADEEEIARFPSESTVNADVEAAYTYLRTVLHVPADKIIAFGRSIGTGPTCHIAMRAPVKAVMLQAPLASVYRILFDLRFSLPGDSFCNIDKVSKIDVPVFIMHGLADEIVPVWHGVELWKRLRRPATPYWVPGGNHNQLDQRSEFVGRIRDFLADLKSMDEVRSEAGSPARTQSGLSQGGGENHVPDLFAREGLAPLVREVGWENQVVNENMGFVGEKLGITV